MVDFKYPEKTRNTINDGWENVTKDNEDNIIGNCHSYELNNLGKMVKVKGKQSPININTKSVHDCNLMCGLSIDYKPSKCHISKDNQNIINLDWDENSSITFNNKKLPLQKVYFHTPSHHLIDGNSSVMEINLYHSLSTDFLPEGEGFETHIDTDLKEDHAHVEEGTHNNNFIKNKGVIISILVKEGKGHIGTKGNKFISQFITNSNFKKMNKIGKNEENKITEISVSEDWNINDLIPNKMSFFSYEGSLPMPPCFETFNWIVFEEQIEIMKEYIDIFRQEGNPSGYRNTHPLNGRIVFYNHTVEVKEEDIKEETKSDMINKMIAPIRITTDSRSGVEYRSGARKIIDSYYGGQNKDYNSNEDQLEILSNGWDDLGKAGEQDLTLQEIIDLREEDSEKYYDYVASMIFDAKKYNYTNYFETYMDKKGFKQTIIDTEKDYDTIVEKACMELSNLNSNNTFFNNGTTLDYTYDTIKSNVNDKFKGDNINELSLHFPTEDKKLLLLFLLSWHMDTYENYKYVNLLDLIDTKEEKYEINNFILQELNKEVVEELKNMIFKFQGEDLTYTLEGDECQDWGSNEVHHEGNILNLFTKNTILSKSGYTFDEMTTDTKTLARDGLLNKSINGKWNSHNKCRDPGGLEGAPWCYTKNPKVRWGHCMVPDRAGNMKKYLLFVIFIMLIVISVYLVKMIFRHELFSQLIAKLTGAEFATEAVFKANQVANTIKSNLK
jgi:carbonic anhydrase